MPMERIVVLDFGGQYSHLISRRVRESGVFSQVMPSDSSLEDIESTEGLRGVILSGGAASVYDPDSPRPGFDIFKLKVPVLGICYGHQLIAHLAGGCVEAGKSGEYGTTVLTTESAEAIMEDIPGNISVWMNHRDIVSSMPQGFKTLSSTGHSPVAAYSNGEEGIYGVQFHPEVTHTECGMRIIENFIRLSGAKKQWGMQDFIKTAVDEAKSTIGDEKAIIGLSGGIDSCCAAVLTSRAIGENLTAVYVDTGLMRHRETEFMHEAFSGKKMRFVIVDAKKEFFEALSGITDPEAKRKAIGETFIRVFEKEAGKAGAKYLIQGTIYSDRIESGVTKHSDNIKSHHNVGGLPKDMDLKVYEPLRDLYKDEVRKIGEKLGLSSEIIKRHVFPGPGLGIRILGEVTPEKAKICRMAGHIVEDELRKAGIYEDCWMGFAVLLPCKTVGIQGDSRSYKYPVAVRIVESHDAMTSNFKRVPYDILESISTRITNEISEVNRVVYDITNKPPGTMEWE